MTRASIVVHSKLQSEKAQGESHSCTSNFYRRSHDCNVSVLVVQLEGDLLCVVLQLCSVSGCDIPNRLTKPCLGCRPVRFLVELEEGLMDVRASVVADGFVSRAGRLVGHPCLEYGN